MQGRATKETRAKYKDGLQNLCLVTIVGELVDDLITKCNQNLICVGPLEKCLKWREMGQGSYFSY